MLLSFKVSLSSFSSFRCIISTQEEKTREEREYIQEWQHKSNTTEGHRLQKRHHAIMSWSWQWFVSLFESPSSFRLPFLTAFPDYFSSLPFLTAFSDTRLLLCWIFLMRHDDVCTQLSCETKRVDYEMNSWLTRFETTQDRLFVGLREWSLRDPFDCDWLWLCDCVVVSLLE